MFNFCHVIKVIFIYVHNYSKKEKKKKKTNTTYPCDMCHITIILSDKVPHAHKVYGDSLKVVHGLIRIFL